MCIFYELTKFYFLIVLTSEILGDMCIAIVCFTGYDVIKFEINLVFLIDLFFYMTKKSRQNFKYLENERSF